MHLKSKRRNMSMNMFSAFYSRQFFVGGQLQSAFEEWRCPRFLGAGQKVVEVVNTQLSLGHMHRIGLASRRVESFRRGETRPQFHCLVHLLPANWTPALPALLEFAILDFLSWHFYSGMFFLDNFILELWLLTFMELSSSSLSCQF